MYRVFLIQLVLLKPAVSNSLSNSNISPRPSHRQKNIYHKQFRRNAKHNKITIVGIMNFYVAQCVIGLKQKYSPTIGKIRSWVSLLEINKTLPPIGRFSCYRLWTISICVGFLSMFQPGLILLIQIITNIPIRQNKSS